MRQMLVAAMLLPGVCWPTFAQEPKPADTQKPMGWTQLSLSTCGVDEFLRANPQSDGRGVVIAILDTGVDPTIPGLDKMPDGEVKVVDVQDFTGDGDVELDWIRWDEEKKRLIRFDEDGTEIEYIPPNLPATPAGQERRWWFGTLEEKRFINADQPDLNDNDKKDDVFPVLVVAYEGEADDHALAFVDTNMDRSFADERELMNYRLRYDTFTFQRTRPESQIEPMTFAVNIFLRQQKVVFHFDNGAHGTHVAGIAAGYQINGQPDFHGVAPGAKLMSLKIGKGELGGPSVTESKKKALRYAAEYARKHDVPVVCNLSYGVDSEIEGQSDIDELLNEVLRENPYLVFCTSAGNSGPGLSTVGTPAAASSVIAVGALMAADTGRDVAGYSLDQPVVTTFSSRGGEAAKPDISCPGWSTSTVPRFVQRGDFWAGTSMASPYAAGLCALLVSHELQNGSAATPRMWDVRQALQLSSRMLEGFSPLDQGYGVPWLPDAAEALAELAQRARQDPLIGYEITTPGPYAYEGKEEAAFWRSTWFPQEDRQVFTIRPIFAPQADTRTIAEFSRKFELRSRTPWCRIAQDSIYLRSDQTANVFVEYEAAALGEPGVYTGIVEALSDGLVAFRLLNTIIVPFRFGPGENFERTFRERIVRGWQPDRYFVAVPPGASSMRVRLTAPEGEESEASIESIFNPRGERYRDRGDRLDTEGGRHEVEQVFDKELLPGVWEIPVVANRPDRVWPYELNVRFFGLHSQPREIKSGSQTRPAGDLLVTNSFEKPLPVKAEGVIEGFRMHKEDKFEGLDDELSYSVSLDERCNRLRLELEMQPAMYATTTDIAVQVLDSDGDAIYQSAFGGRTHEATVNMRGKKSGKVVITAGFAFADADRKVPITVNIDQLLSKPVDLKVTFNDQSNFTSVPGVPQNISYKAGEKLDDAPKGYGPVGYIRFLERGSDAPALRVPLFIED